MQKQELKAPENIFTGEKKKAIEKIQIGKKETEMAASRIANKTGKQLFKQYWNFAFDYWYQSNWRTATADTKEKEEAETQEVVKVRMLEVISKQTTRRNLLEWLTG